MSDLVLTADAVARMIAHARAASPIEACGYLGERNGVVSAVARLTNADASPDHFRLLPVEQFAAVRRFRDAGFDLKGVYHSHPVGPARMSPEDARLATDPLLSYVIVSLAAYPPECRSYRMAGGFFREERLETVESSP